MWDEEERVDEAARLSTRLEALHRMYQRLSKVSMGTGIVEAEAMQVVWEKMCGPTGHTSLMQDQDLERYNNNKSECSEEVKRCWRDPEVVRALLALRMTSVKEQLVPSQGHPGN